MSKHWVVTIWMHASASSSHGIGASTHCWPSAQSASVRHSPSPGFSRFCWFDSFDSEAHAAPRDKIAAMAKLYLRLLFFSMRVARASHVPHRRIRDNANMPSNISHIGISGRHEVAEFRNQPSNF